MARQVQTKQRSFDFKGWGGRRKGAGRPRKPGSKLRHASREHIASRFPAHVTYRAVAGAPNLRRAPVYSAIADAIRAANAGGTIRIVHFTVQTNRAVNRAARRRGKLWGDRYHLRALRAPRDVRNALCYVLQNARRHSDRAGLIDVDEVPRSA